MSMMILHAVRRSMAVRSIMLRRGFAESKSSTAAAKRALNQQQLKGETPSPEPPKPPIASSSSAPPPSVDPSSGGGNFMLPIAIVATGAGVVWYYDLLPHGLLKGRVEVPKPTVEVPKPAPMNSKKGNTKEDDVSPILEAVEVSPDEVGASTVQKENDTTSESPVSREDQPPSKFQAPLTVAELPPAFAMEAAKELQAAGQRSSATLQKANQELRDSVNESLFKDLEGLSDAELRVRIVQLGTDLTQHTKWEAVRLKEFLVMKEKEVGEQYLELMQKQRLEFEDTLARKLRDQEDALTRQANALLQEKEAGINAVVNATRESLEMEHETNLASTKELLEAQLSAKYEAEFAQKLAEEKQKFSQDLQQKVDMMEQLSRKLEAMESALSVSRSFSDGSLKAHRVSAAALALADKLETSKSAMDEVVALMNVSEDNSVILSAARSIPESVKVGIPTLSELQTKFEDVYSKGRQAALVPAGRVGLEGQLMGTVLSTLKYAPNPDDPVPEESGGEYVLARARKHVQLGELEVAVEQLNKLDGQTAFTVRSWTKSAKDRIEAEKALHVIKMEVALMNESLAKALPVE